MTLWYVIGVKAFFASCFIVVPGRIFMKPKWLNRVPS